MNARRCIEIHRKLWAKKPRSFVTLNLRPGNLRFVTQNLTKRSRHTDWIKGDPQHRRLTWIFGTDGYNGYVREYAKQGRQVTEVWTTNPEMMVYREVS